jgi:precorrin-4/cobalt-precorrin-4 C11-methyltransferase
MQESLHDNKGENAMIQVHFIGAGPGDPDLITVKGKRLIEEADVIIYAGSLVNPQVLAGAKEGAQIYNSATMTLPEVIAVMKAAAEEGKMVARVHTGDPSIYGAHREQMQELDRLGISYDVIPGVSSFLAAAAAMNREYTLPSVSQTVILTRMEGRTPVPEMEQIEALAAHQSTMIIFLSVGEIETLCIRLQNGGYPADTPAAVVYKASWEDQKIVTGTLKDIAEKVRQAGIRKTALVTVGRFLGDEFELSKLYDENFTHEFRKASVKK